MIVLNENEWALEQIKKRELGKNPAETLNRIAKYYISSGFKKREAKERMEQFILQCKPNACLNDWQDVISRSLRSASKYPPIKIESINITRAELDTLSSLKSAQQRRLAFTLLCVAKFWDTVSKKNHHWTNNSDKELLKMANINTSIKRQSLLFAALRQAGLIRFSGRVDDLNVQVLFISDDSEVVFRVTDFRNLGNQYLMLNGGPYFECGSCGIVTKIPNPGRGRPPKYCADCMEDVRIKKTVASVKRARECRVSL